MSISRRNPFGLLSEFNRQMEDALEEEGASSANGGLTRWRPRVDIYEVNDELVFKVDVPGIRKSNLDVSLENNQLTVRGRREDVREERNDRNYFRAERLHGTFQRTFSLPRDVERDEIEADYDGGVLTVRVPKSTQARKQTIEIN